jgi:4-carboxymuconolactone decarboxylase
MTERLPPLPPDQQDDAYRRAVERFRAVRGADPFGPFPAMLRSPDLTPLVAAVGEYCRHGNALGHRATELVILLVARHYEQPVEWSIHAPIAAKAGVPPEAIDAIAHRRRWAGLTGDDALVHDATAELLAGCQLSDPQYQAVVDRFGERGAVDLAATVGYYGLLALVMNVARTTPPNGPALP